MRLLAPAFGLLAPLLACNTLFPPRPEVQWNAGADVLVISADTCCGMVYDPNGIPDARLWGDGRLVWTEYDGAARRVRTGTLAPDETAALLQSFVDAGFFGWRDYYAPAGPIYDAPSTCLHVVLASASKSVCEMVEGAPRQFGELYRHLAAGAGAQAADYTPSTGYLQATAITVTNPEPGAAEWLVDITGLSLRESTGGVWIEGEALASAWTIVNAGPLYPLVQEGGRFYTLVLLIPDLTRTAPPAANP